MNLPQRRSPAAARGESTLWDCKWCGALLETLAGDERPNRPEGPCPLCGREAGWRRREFWWRMTLHPDIALVAEAIHEADVPYGFTLAMHHEGVAVLTRSVDGYEIDLYPLHLDGATVWRARGVQPFRYADADTFAAALALAVELVAVVPPSPLPEPIEPTLFEESTP